MLYDTYTNIISIFYQEHHYIIRLINKNAYVCKAHHVQ
jgi:hypothetical protein